MHASLATPKALQRTSWSVDRDGVLVGHHYASISKLLLPCTPGSKQPQVGDRLLLQKGEFLNA